jgi:hypothetical protein
VLAAEHELELPLVESRLQRLDRQLQIGADVLSLAQQLRADFGVLGLLLEPAEGFELLAETGAGLQDRLGAAGIVPQTGIGDDLLDLGELLGARFQIKGAPGDR